MRVASYRAGKETSWGVVVGDHVSDASRKSTAQHFSTDLIPERRHAVRNHDRVRRQGWGGRAGPTCSVSSPPRRRARGFGKPDIEAISAEGVNGDSRYPRELLIR
jgi:hypothetical protein